MRSHTLITVCLLLASAVYSARAEAVFSLDINPASGTPIFQPGNSGDPESSRFSFIPFTGYSTALNADFSLPETKQLTVEFKAPVGQRFLAEIPEASAGWELRLLVFQWYFSATLQSSGIFVESAPMVSFGNFSGDTPFLASAVGELSGPDFGFNSNGWLFGSTFTLASGSSFSFDSLSISLTVPDTYNAQFASSAIPTIQASLTDFNFSSPDPGAWFRLVAIPEPSVFSLIALGLVLSAMRRVLR